MYKLNYNFKKCINSVVIIIDSANSKLRHSNIFLFVITNVILSYVVLVPLIACWIFFGGDNNFSGPTSVSETTVTTFIVVCIVAPLFETLVFQWTPIRFMQRTRRFAVWHMVLVSAVIFGLEHWYSFYYVLYTFSIGTVLAYSFIMCDGTNKSSYWSVVLIHSIRNFITFIILLLNIQI